MRESISVCMATYNGERYIRPQLESILSQLNDTDEIIVSDDGSTDNTCDIIKSYGDNRIKLISNTGTRGYTSNFENALQHSKNQIIFLSDQDDIWLKNKVSICLKELENTAFVVHDATIVNQNLNIISPSYFNERKVLHGFWGNIIKFGYLGCCMAFRREVLNAALPFPPNHHLCTHDNWLFLVASKSFRYKVIYQSLILYRRHSSNTSTGGKKRTLDLFFMLKYRLYLLYHLFSKSL